MSSSINLTIIGGEKMKDKTPISSGIVLNINIDIANIIETLANLGNSNTTLQSQMSNAIPHGEHKFTQIDCCDADSSDKGNSINTNCSDEESKNKFDGGGSKQITERQKATIRSMCEKQAYDPDEYSTGFVGKRLDDLCGSEANKLIKSLKGVKNARM